MALILEVMFQTESGRELETIGDDAINGAIQLTEYFRQTSIYINEKIKEVSFKTETDQQIYKELPTEFNTSDIISISSKYGVNENTVKKRLIPRLLNSRQIKREMHGKYSKNSKGTVHNVHSVHKYIEPDVYLKDHNAQSKILFGKEFVDLNESQKKAITNVFVE